MFELNSSEPTGLASGSTNGPGWENLPMSQIIRATSDGTKDVDSDGPSRLQVRATSSTSSPGLPSAPSTVVSGPQRLGTEKWQSWRAAYEARAWRQMYDRVRTYHWFWLCVGYVAVCLAIILPLTHSLEAQSLVRLDLPVEDVNATIGVSGTLSSFVPENNSVAVDWSWTGAICSLGNQLSPHSISFIVTVMTDFGAAESYMNITDVCGNFSESPTPLRTVMAVTPARAPLYPFDSYSTSFSLWAVNDDGSPAGFGIDYINGFTPGFTTRLDVYYSQPNDIYYAAVVITRSTAVRAYVVAVVVAIWLVSLTFLTICISVIFLGRTVRAEVLVAPIASVFAFTGLRGSLPGAPTDFSAAIDIMGTLPCLALLAFSAVLLTGVFLFRDPEKSRHGLQPRDMESGLTDPQGREQELLKQLLQGVIAEQAVLKQLLDAVLAAQPARFVGE